MFKYIAIAALVAVTAQSGMFSTVSGMGMKEVKPDHEYTVDTVGVNPRIYEFRSKTDPNVLCVLVFGNDQGNMQLSCVKIKDK
jgi:hypothetical protein